MLLPQKVVFDHAESLIELDADLKPVFDRLLQKCAIPSDHEAIVDVLEGLLPDNMIMYPNGADVYTNDEGHIRFEITAYKVTAVA
jgi:hypothetical protein